MNFHVVLLSIFFLTTSCLSSNKTEVKEIKSETTTSVKKVEKKSADKKDADKKATEKKNPTSCKIDDQCLTYFRCIDAKCTNPPAISGVSKPNTPTATIKAAKGSSHAFKLELAVSIKEMTRGLMYRTTMLKDWGMLFIYDDVRIRSFWMKNTLIPLDMLFIDEKGVVVGIIEGAEPMTRTARTVGKPSKYVLELIAGRSKELGIKAGDKMSLTNVEDWQNIEK